MCPTTDSATSVLFIKIRCLRQRFKALTAAPLYYLILQPCIQCGCENENITLNAPAILKFGNNVI